jgi:condensin-2 complex subunit D3
MAKYLSLNSQSELDKYASIMTSVMFLLGECAAIGLEANSGQGVQEKVAEDGNIRPRAIDISASLVTLVQALLAPSIVSSTASIESAVISVPEVVRAHAYLCLGKFCLRDAALAKRYITVFIRDLSAATSPMSVRNNILFVLGDLCVRYTALVDRYIPSLAACITDSHPAIRKHAVILLTQLVVEEYVKFRGPLFYRLAGALADSDETVRQCAEAAVTGTLMSKYKTAFTSHFIGLLFVSTGCANSTAFRHLLGGIESEGAAGEATIASDRFMEFAMPSAARRHHIYSTLIKALPDDQKLVVYGKLASDVLGAVTEGTVHLTHAKSAGAFYTETFSIGSTELLVADAFTMMSLKDMRAAVSSRGAGAKVDAGEDEPEAQFGGEMDAGGAAAVAKSKVIGKLVKRQMIENILPICLGLRQFLTAQRSPLMQQLLGYLKVLSEDHADELKGTLSAPVFPTTPFI